MNGSSDKKMSMRRKSAIDVIRYRNRLHRLVGKTDECILPNNTRADKKEAKPQTTTIFDDKYQRNYVSSESVPKWCLLLRFCNCRRFLNLKFFCLKNRKRMTQCLLLLRVLLVLGMLFMVGILFNRGWGSYDPMAVTMCLVPSSTFFISPRCGFHPNWHPLSRHDRFPSIEDRVKLYMSTWYYPPCSSSERLRFQYLLQRDNLGSSRSSSTGSPPPVQIVQYSNAAATTNITLQSRMEPDTIFALHENGLRPDFKRYPQDAQKILHLYHALFPGHTTTQLPPIVITLGDSGGEDFAHHPIPYFCKWRPVAQPSDWKKWMAKNVSSFNHSTHEREHTIMESCIESMERRGRFGQELYSSNQTMYAPIVWSVSYRRHFRYVSWVPWYDTWWERKKQGAIWRGVLTGAEGRIVMGDSFVSNCQRVPRCKFVMKFCNSDTLNVGVSFQLDEFPVTNEMYIKSMVKGTVSLRNMMQYKAIIILEGNDVASGLKWALYSRSVVMMPEPTKTSFAMEELLVPWVHYIPLLEDGLDAEEKLNWVLENDEKARMIAERATLFMHDMLFHERAAQDNMEVEMEILRRYHSLYDKK